MTLGDIRSSPSFLLRHFPSAVGGLQIDDLREQRQAWRDWEEYRRDRERYRRDEWPGYLELDVTDE